MPNKKFIFEKHIQYFQSQIKVLPDFYTSQDTNRITLLYFCIHGLDILNSLEILTKEKKQQIINWVYSLQVIPQNNNNNNNNNNKIEKTNIQKSGFRGGTFFGNKFDPQNGSNGIHDYDFGHLAMTYTALSILRILGDPLDKVNKEAISKGILSTQQKDGSFASISVGSEKDVRFSFCASAILALLFLDCKNINKDGFNLKKQENKDNEENEGEKNEKNENIKKNYYCFDWEKVFNTKKCIQFLNKSRGYDYSFGHSFECETHGGSTYCCLSSIYLIQLSKYLLSLNNNNNNNKINDNNKNNEINVENDDKKNWLNKIEINLNKIINDKQFKPFELEIDNKRRLGEWLLRRQISGFHGRPQKDPDVCYSFWVISGLKMLGFDKFVDDKSSILYTLSCQFDKMGGIRKNLKTVFPDVLHSCLGLSGLSLATQGQFEYFKNNKDNKDKKDDDDKDDDNKEILKLRKIFAPLGITERCLKDFCPLYKLFINE